MKVKSKSQLLTELVDARIELSMANQLNKHLQHQVSLSVEIVKRCTEVEKETLEEYKKLTALYNEHQTIIISNIMKSQSN